MFNNRSSWPVSHVIVPNSVQKLLVNIYIVGCSLKLCRRDRTKLSWTVKLGRGVLGFEACGLVEFTQILLWHLPARLCWGVGLFLFLLESETYTKANVYWTFIAFWAFKALCFICATLLLMKANRFFFSRSKLACQKRHWTFREYQRHWWWWRWWSSTSCCGTETRTHKECKSPAWGVWQHFVCWISF